MPTDDRLTLALPDAAGKSDEGERGEAPVRSRARRWTVLGFALPVAVLALIEVLVRTQVVPDHLLPAPTTIAETLAQMGPGRLARHIAASTLRVFAGFAIGAVLAFALGAAMGLSRRIDALLEPTFQGLRAIPSLAWVPVLLLWMGIDEAPKITLVAIGAFFPVHLAVVAGIRGVDRKLLELGAIYQLSPFALFRRILLPAALPQIFTGLRTGLSLAWMFMVAAELIAATRGLGYMLSDGRETGRPDIVFGAIFLLAVLGKLTDGAMRWLEHRLLNWRDAFDAHARDGAAS
ncbi:ABC transporter permease [Paraburkholderia caballeronis]|uniref:Sulfonate transport system permease protein n=1 Tax=Paraburkholderia caballeronis TaxID=416943 RepID=A0A1H7TS72_9BURK|nr:ABC transporter permease [Paraburkholderia caballeronis]PXW17627.1 sulfonate transport system permease protein [Paraburkholderia caballeronis]PXW95372.1 sulfonate transport system permease protein [Paraburkholderia caballeronis]RAJ91186.1 sulfonate transport system permease protein [Paraburkholderia caballeronis]SEE13735.1 sulfonate transport system permease protein [Paraburkholderia caballeronis]SEL87591.1 sulfonate transport system permease protein [Paraburkholderia caballeronis]